MKCLILYIKESSLKSVSKILLENDTEGISYFEVQGRGKLDREVQERLVQGYRTGETYTPEFAKRIRIETIVPDPIYTKIVEALKKDDDIKGKIFSYNIDESLDI